jgi:hypothetical protein
MNLERKFNVKIIYYNVIQLIQWHCSMFKITSFDRLKFLLTLLQYKYLKLLFYIQSQPVNFSP